MPSKVKKAPRKQRQLPDIHSNFIMNMEALGAFVTTLQPIVEKHDKASIRRLVRTIRKIAGILGADKTETKEREKTTAKLTDEKINQMMRLTNELKGVPIAQAAVLYRSSFVMLISHFDFLISDLLAYYLRNHPESLSEKELSLTLRDLKLFDTIDDAVDFVINREVEKLLYQNLERQRNYFKTFLKVDTADDLVDWARINEAVERRNIIVHNDSQVNQRYLNNIDPSFAPEKKSELKEGNPISINEKYFREVFDELIIAGIILTQNCWRKWGKDELETADDTLISAVYDTLCKERWKTAERLGLFSIKCQVHDQTSKLYLYINYCQSLKWQGRTQELEEELEKIDVSALSPKMCLKER